MKKITLFIVIFSFSFYSTYSQERSNLNLLDLYQTAIKNVNFSTPISEDSIIRICNISISTYQNSNNRDTIYGVSEIEINSLCLKGDIGLAISKANLMYEDARRHNSTLGVGLALQAISETYIHSNQLKQANESLTEAAQYINRTNTPYAQLRLLIQQMYVSMELNNMAQLQKHILETIECSKNMPELLKNDINFYISCYQTLHAIGSGETIAAGKYLKKAMEIEFPHNYYNIWKFYINSKYHELIGEYNIALDYNKSLLECIEDKNPNTYISFLIKRAILYEKHKEPVQSCNTYAVANQMFDSLNATQYTSQIDSLRVTYLVDQMNIENAVSLNRMLMTIIICSCIMLIIISVLIRLARNKNRQLKESQQSLSEKRYEAKKSVQSKSLIISNMSHDLRTPLSAIISFSGLLANNYKSIDKDTDLKKQCTEIISHNSNILFKHLNDITNITDINDKEMEILWDQCDVVALCNHISNATEKILGPSVIYRFKTNIESLIVDTDQRRLQQVITNILSNSIKFTSSGYITLQLSQAKNNETNTILFTIEDTGCGIPKEKQAKIFQYSEDKQQELGLPICQLIISRLGGKIWFDPAYKHGTKIMFTHPITTSHTKSDKSK